MGDMEYGLVGIVLTGTALVLLLKGSAWCWPLYASVFVWIALRGYDIV